MQFRSKLVPSSVHGPIGFTTNAFYWAMTRALRMVAPWFAISWGDLRKAAGGKGMKSYGGCRPAAHLHLKSFLVEYPQQLEPGGARAGGVGRHGMESRVGWAEGGVSRLGYWWLRWNNSQPLETGGPRVGCAGWEAGGTGDELVPRVTRWAERGMRG